MPMPIESIRNNQTRPHLHIQTDGNVKNNNVFNKKALPVEDNLSIANSAYNKAKEILSEKNYSIEDIQLILNSVNKHNIEFLEKITNLSYFNGSNKYSGYSVWIVLKEINQHTAATAKELFSGDISKLDLMPYEIAEKINPELLKKRIENLKIANDNNPVNIFEQNLNIAQHGILQPNILPKEKISPENLSKKVFLEKFFQNEFKEIHLRNSTNPEVKKIEEEMKKLGINVIFEDDLETAQEILNVCKKLNEQGIELPKEILLMTPHSDSVRGFTPIMKKGYEKRAQIFIQKGIGTNKESSDPFFKTVGLNHFTDDTPGGTFTHELGHWHHLQYCLEDAHATKIWTEYVTSENEMAIAAKVSAHAMTDPTGKEFIAEVFSGMCKGIKYDDEVMNLYNALKGPKIQITL